MALTDDFADPLVCKNVAHIFDVVVTLRRSKV